MSLLANLKQFWQAPKQQSILVLLAGMGAIPGLPLVGLHKFYLGQTRWGVFYLLLFWTPIPHFASAYEAVWYLLRTRSQFDEQFNPGLASTPQSPTAPKSGLEPQEVAAIAAALRELEQLRQEGLLSEYEFEQKRRQLVDP
ncbi:MAG: NINE protein [Cyanobacteria bacterium P01_G01_bin.54]